MAVNSITLVGNLVRDMEVKATTSGSILANFTLAVNTREKNQQTGEWEDVPSFIDCTMFGNRAESVSRFVGKGSRVAVSGHIKQRRWEAKDGGKRSKLEVIVEELDFMSRQRSEEPTYEEPSYAAPAPKPAPVMDFYDEDCPF